MPDVLAAGYGGMWTPPPGRADQGGFSVGYDAYDRFDLGYAGNPTLYGTESGLKTTVGEMHKVGVKSYVDLVWNHSGFSDWNSVDGSGHTFKDAGGYPGMVLGPGSGNFGDYHDPTWTGSYYERLAGLLDINHETNNQYVRSPVPGNPNNIAAGTVSAFGRLANVPTAANTRFYPDHSLTPIVVFDGHTGESNVPIYPFNTTNPGNGTPVQENAMAYLMRNAQWLVQEIGADGFRLDATKNLTDLSNPNNPDPLLALYYYDRATFRAIKKLQLDGSEQHVFGFGEYFDTNMGLLQQVVRKDMNTVPNGTIGGNRDTLDVPLYYAMQNNLSGNGLNNDWANVVNASFDVNDGFANNGSQGVAFVSSHDNGPPALQNVAYAYTLMRPGNALVYFNAKEFGEDREFPGDGRGDALGGLYGNQITKLVDLRNRYGRGNYQPRWQEKELLAYERENSAVVLLSNRVDAGFDTRLGMQTAFAPGTRLVEMTGNAQNATSDPFGDIPPSVTVQGDGKIDVRFLRNMAPGTSNFTGNGFLIYAPPSPQGTLSIGGASATIAGGTPTAGTNGTTRLSSVKVVTGNSFTVTLNTNAVTIPGWTIAGFGSEPAYRDFDADGDNALLRLDGGVDVNGVNNVDYTAPGSVSYGYEEFTTTHLTGTRVGGDGNGTYAQTIDTTNLSEGMHYVAVRAFRRRNGNEPAIFSDFSQAVYVDRFAPVLNYVGFVPNVEGVNENRSVVVTSDGTVDNMHVLLDQPITLSDSAVLAMVNGGNQASRSGNDLWRSYGSVGNGNHTVIYVTYELSGRTTIGRHAGQYTSTIVGKGFGDTDFDNAYEPGNINGDAGSFANVLANNTVQFNAAGDLDGDGVVSDADLVLLHPWLVWKSAGGPTISTTTDLRVSRAINTNGILTVPSGTLNASGTLFPAATLSVVNNFNLPTNFTLHKTGTGALSILGPQSHATGAALSLEAGTTTMSSDGQFNLSIATSGAGTQFNITGNQHLASLTIGAGTTTSVTGTNSRTVVTKNLSIDGGANPTGKLDINNTRLVVDYNATAASPVALIRSQVVAGRNGTDFANGDWSGNGIASSTAAAGDLVSFAIGYVDNSFLPQVGLPSYTLFGGQAVDSSSVLVRYTLGADANLDGKVNTDDVTIVGALYNNAGSGEWYFGDFDYDGMVDTDDVTVLGALYNATAPALSQAQLSAQFGSEFAAAFELGRSLGPNVPEPTGAAIAMMAGAAGMLSRRSRRRQ